MKLEKKRKVIEALLWAGSDENLPVTSAGLEHDFETMNRAHDEHWKPNGFHPIRDYETCACEAAYRLIESSPTLRREWFGAP